MHSFISSTRFSVSPQAYGDLNFLFDSESERAKRQQKAVSLQAHGPLIGIACFRKRRDKSFKMSGSPLEISYIKESNRSCKQSGFSDFVMRSKDRDSEGDLELEAEASEFITKPKDPQFFPCEKELIDEVRIDVHSDLDEEEGNRLQEGGLNGGKLGISNECDSCQEENDSVSANSCELPSPSSGRSLEISEEAASGIEGILYRLEKDRIMKLDIGLKGNTHIPNGRTKDAGISTNTTVAGLNRSRKPASSSPENDVLKDTKDKLCHHNSLAHIDRIRNPVRPHISRTWSSRRAGLVDKKFGGGIINSLGDNSNVGSGDLSNGSEDVNSFFKENSPYLIRTRLQHLESVLSSVLQNIKPKDDEGVLQMEGNGSFKELLQLSDALEFKENEIMDTHDRLQRTRAKLAVLEGKLELAMIDAQRIVEEKQKRINDARKALQLLRTACIVWHNTASEVLLAGSFDGWATQRKMEKSRSGVFSLCLKLYPGKHEIKFIVDGQWRTDPRRPTVNNNGFVNNLLIVT